MHIIHEGLTERLGIGCYSWCFMFVMSCRFFPILHFVLMQKYNKRKVTYFNVHVSNCFSFHRCFLAFCCYCGVWSPFTISFAINTVSFPSSPGKTVLNNTHYVPGLPKCWNSVLKTKVKKNKPNQNPAGFASEPHICSFCDYSWLC